MVEVVDQENSCFSIIQSIQSCSLVEKDDQELILEAENTEINAIHENMHWIKAKRTTAMKNQQNSNVYSIKKQIENYQKK